MDEMTAFDRQIADEVLFGAGPSEPVDDLAVYRSVMAANESHRWGFTMFSALKFIAASVIVALFGGFLLSSVLTTRQGDEVVPAAVTASPAPSATSEATESSDPSVRTDILPGLELTVEEVEPGVIRVLNDGVMDLEIGKNTDIVAGYDDGVWLLRKNRFQRLGDKALHRWPSEQRSGFGVAPDQTVWLYYDGTVHSYDGAAWAEWPALSGGFVWDFAVAPDGTVWISWQSDDYKSERLGRLGPDGWHWLDSHHPSADDELDEHGFAPHELLPTASGDLVGVWRTMVGGMLYRFVDGAWQEVAANKLPAAYGFSNIDVGPKGTIWLIGEAEVRAPTVAPWYELQRHVGVQQDRWVPEDLPDTGVGLGLDDEFVVAPDGSLWASLWQRGRGAEATRGWVDREDAVKDRRAACDGVARFDGKNTDRFLRGRCVTMDVDADGSVWVLADKKAGSDLYVITPEAVAK